MTRITCVFGILSILLVSAGCVSEAPDVWNKPLDVKGPISADDGLIYLNRGLENIEYVEPEQNGDSFRVDVTRVDTAPSPSKVKLSKNGDRLFVLSREEESLSIFDLTSSSFPREDIQLESPYDRIMTDPAGEFVLLGFDESQSRECVACNLSELGVVDLRGDTPDSARFVTLSNPATNVIFAESFEFAGEQQRLAIAMAQNQVTLIDLKALVGDDSENALREIPLAADRSQSREPTQAIVEPKQDSGEVNIYLLTDPGSDIIEVSLAPNTNSESNNKFNIRIENQFAAGQRPAAMTLFETSQGAKRILSIDGQAAQFTMVDLDSGESRTFPLPSNRANEHLLRYQISDGSGDEQEGEVRILAYSTLSTNVTVIYPERISMGDDPALAGRNMETLSLSSRPSKIELAGSSSSRRAIAFHQGTSEGFSVLNLETNDVVPIKGASLASITFTDTYAYGTFQGRADLGKFDLSTSHPSVFELPHEGTALMDDAEDDLVLVQHEDRAGAFTVMDAEQPDDYSVFKMVFADRLFERGL